MSSSSGHCQRDVPSAGSQFALGTGWFSPSLMRKPYIISCVMTRAKSTPAVRADKMKGCSREELLYMEFTSGAKHSACKR